LLLHFAAARRRQIADALVRTAATRGLHATGMREVAAEAGVSLRLVQYYFGTKQELLLAAMQQLAAQFSDRAMTRIRQSRQGDGPASPRDVVTAILTAALPADDERRTVTLVYTAYFALSLTDPALAISPFVGNSNAVSDVIAAQLRTAQTDGDTPAGLDPDPEAVSLMTMSAAWHQRPVVASLTRRFGDLDIAAGRRPAHTTMAAARFPARRGGTSRGFPRGCSGAR
jgi:AcrR family transcriptional regulator